MSRRGGGEECVLNAPSRRAEGTYEEMHHVLLYVETLIGSDFS